MWGKFSTDFNSITIIDWVGIRKIIARVQRRTISCFWYTLVHDRCDFSA